MADVPAEVPADGGGAAATGAPLVRVERQGPVTTLVLDSPANRNALSARLLAELAAALDAAAADDQVRVVVIGATGPAFCAGADLRERLHPPEPRPATTVAGVLSAIMSSAKPVIAKVHGHVRAGGVGLVAACDLAVASAAVTFGLSEVRVGVAPAVIAVPVLARVRRRAWERWALTGDAFGAPEALDAGLLSAVVEDARALDEWTAGTVRSLLKAAPGALATTKRLAALATRPWEEAISTAGDLSDELFAAPDAAEGMAAFLEKRPPAWVLDWGPPAGSGPP